MKLAILLYQGGIANVFRVQSMIDPKQHAERLLQGTFGQCEMFARGLAAAGVTVRSMYANVAGDALLDHAVWSENPEECPFRESTRPVNVRTPAAWPDKFELLTAELDGKRIAYTSATEFLVQVGRGNGAYKTQYRIIGNLAHAVSQYMAINIGLGYKKRLYMPSCSTRPTLAKQVS